MYMAYYCLASEYYLAVIQSSTMKSKKYQMFHGLPLDHMSHARTFLQMFLPFSYSLVSMPIP